ncbi:hypothetical protein TNCV_560661 [Trichonephila clavipes]|nr:hypothetical protein TNCV_560661 [Trichonephila clavipes]
MCGLCDKPHYHSGQIFLVDLLMDCLLTLHIEAFRSHGTANHAQMARTITELSKILSQHQSDRFEPQYIQHVSIQLHNGSLLRTGLEPTIRLQPRDPHAVNYDCSGYCHCQWSLEKFKFVD